MGSASAGLWELQGNAIVMAQYIRLTPDVQSKWGAVWNRVVRAGCGVLGGGGGLGCVLWGWGGGETGWDGGGWGVVWGLGWRNGLKGIWGVVGWREGGGDVGWLRLGGRRKRSGCRRRDFGAGGDMERGMGTVGCVLVEWGVKGLEKGVQVERLWGYKESSNWNPT